MSVRLSRALLPIVPIALLAAAALLLAMPANAQTTAVNADAALWVQRLDDDTGEPIDLTRGYWRWPFVNRIDTRDVETLKVRVYVLKDDRDDHGTAPSPSDYASYGDFSSVWLTLKSAAGGNIVANPLTTASLKNKNGSADLTTGGYNAYQRELTPAAWHQNTAGYVSGAPAPGPNDRVQPIDITIDFGSGGLGQNNFFLFTRKNCHSPCSGGTGRDIQYEWKLPHRVPGLGWGMFARLNGATPPEPVLNAAGQAAWDDMHYINQNSDTTLTVRFYFKKTNPDDLTLRPGKPSDPDATYADMVFGHSVYLYRGESTHASRSMTGVRYYNPGTTTRWAGCSNSGTLHECHMNKTTLKTAATTAGASAGDTEESDEVIPVDFDVFIPIAAGAGVGDYPAVRFFGRGGTDSSLESGGNRFPHALGMIKRPALNLNLRRNTYDRGASTCTHDYPIAQAIATETAEQLARIAADESGGSFAHNCDDLSVAPGQSVFIGFWAGFARPDVHPQEYDWNRNDKARIYGYRTSHAMRIREFGRITVTTGGAGSFGIGTRCPEHSYLDAPEDRFYDEGWPKPRTREGMGTCTATAVAWSNGDAERAAGDRHIGAAGLGHFTPYPDASPGTVTLNATAYGSDRDGDGEPDWTATDTLDITIGSAKATVSASDTFVDGETDDGPLAAYVSRSDYNGLISLKVGRLERHAFPIFPKKPADRSGGQPFASVAELAADAAGELEWQEGRTKFGEDGESRGEVLDGHYLGPVLFSNLAEDEAVRITVDRGVVSHEGETCTSSSGGCTLSLSRAELMTSRGRGASGEVGTNANDPFVISYLDYAPDGFGPVTFTVQAFPDSATGWSAAEPTTFTETVPAIAPLGIRAALQDADGLLAPGDRTAVTIGVDGPTDSSSDVRFRLGDGTYEAAVLDRLGGLIGYAAPAAPPSGVQDFASDSYLVISGDATWIATGGKRLPVGNGTTFSKLACTDASKLDSSLAAGDAATCYVVNDDGERPQILVDPAAANGSEIRITASLAAGEAAFNMAHWPDDLIGAPRPFLIPSVFGTATFTVESVTQLASVSLDRKAGQTGAVKTGDPARLKLAVLNENGRASAATAISSITITATSGKIRAGSAEGGSQFCDGSTTCTITIGSVEDDEPNDLASRAVANPALIAGIFVDLYDVKTAGSATVSATVVAAAGDDPVFSAEPLTVVFSGSAASLSLSEKLLRVNAYGTPDADVEADPDADPPVEAVKKDDRDVIKIAVTATDSRGQTADVPRGTPTVLDPDGAPVTSGISASVPDDECNTGRTTCNIVIDVNAPASSPLKSGIYKVRLSSGSLTAAETSFGVAGNPAEITIQIDDPAAVGASFNAEILVLDEAGEPVADGTQVAIAVQRRGRAPAAVQRISAAAQSTANGRVTAAFVVISREVSTIKATAGNAATLAVVDTREVQTPDEDSPAQGLRTAQTNTYTTWSGTGAATAAALLEDLADDADRVFLWNGVRWIVYAEINGRPIPGSINYLIEANDVLWIGSIAN